MALRPWMSWPCTCSCGMNFSPLMATMRSLAAASMLMSISTNWTRFASSSWRMRSWSERTLLVIGMRVVQSTTRAVCSGSVGAAPAAASFCAPESSSASCPRTAASSSRSGSGSASSASTRVSVAGSRSGSGSGSRSASGTGVGSGSAFASTCGSTSASADSWAAAGSCGVGSASAPAGVGAAVGVAFGATQSSLATAAGSSADMAKAGRGA
mmetsp:Transcript_9545/g.34979  ORF Transcript_9545/g.34979 Transcript_9545/m.34979 type:complete len:212 (-) Transcript_9545:108-743(-)